MPDTDSITLVHKFIYRDQREEFSNTYHLDGTTPSDEAGWKDVADDIWALERPIFPSLVKFVRAYGYVAGQDNTVAVIDYETFATPEGGTLSTGSLHQAPGDAAMYCGWWTGALDTRGKKIYLRKYFHGVFIDVDDPDKLAPDQLTALQTFAQAAHDSPLSGDLVLVGPQGAPTVNWRASPWITTRTLKRRGRRPPG